MLRPLKFAEHYLVDEASAPTVEQVWGMLPRGRWTVSWDGTTVSFVLGGVTAASVLCRVIVDTRRL